MASLASIIAAKLDTDVPAVVNVDAGRNIFNGSWPQKPDTAFRVVTYGAGRFDRVMKGGGIGIAAENLTLQIAIRAVELETGDTLAKLVFASLDNFTGVLGGVRFLHISANHSPSMVGVDETTRYLWTVNFNVKKEIG